MVFKVILISPMHAGKSTLGRLLAERLNLPQRSMDKISGAFYDEIGYHRELAGQLEKKGFHELYKYWELFEAYAVERLTAEPEKAVIKLFFNF